MADQDDITGSFNKATERFESLLEDMKKEHPPEKPLACRAGCDHCCYQPEITVTAVETFRLADYITEYLEPAEIKALIKTLVKTRAGAGDKAASWPLAPCPLLKNGRCSVYDVRPLICRGFNSYFISDCETAKLDKAAHAKVRYYEPQVQTAHLTVGAIEKATNEAGLEPLLGDLRPALLTALTQPDARKRWLAGGPVFENAKHKPLTQ